MSTSYMNRLVKVKIRPDGTLKFPKNCINCSQPAEERMKLRKRIGRLTREIDVPLCAECSRELHKESAEEERMHKIGRLLAGVGGAAAFILIFIITPAGLTTLWRLLFSSLSAVGIGVVIFFYFERKSRQAVLPLKQTILESAALSDFSWRATTFEFSNEAFADRFVELNQSQLMAGSSHHEHVSDLG